MKNKHILFLLLAGILFMVSCKKDAAPATLDATTPFTINGTTYNAHYMYFYDIGGGFVQCEDTAVSSNGLRKMYVDMSFNYLTSLKPPTGTYGIFTDTVGLVGANQIEFNFTEFTLSGKVLYTYKIAAPASGTASVTNISDRISVKFGAQNLKGLAYDTVTGINTTPPFNCTLSAATLTEQ